LRLIRNALGTSSHQKLSSTDWNLQPDILMTSA